MEPNTHSSAEVHDDLTELQTASTVEEKTKVRVSGHGEVRDVDVGGTGGFDCSPAGTVADVDGTASFEGLAGLDGDGAGADGAGGDD